MRKFLLCMMAILLAPVSQVHASDVGVSFGINFGYPGAVEPAYAPQPVVIAEPPVFVEPPGFGFYLAIGGPYDLFFVDDAYYLCSGNVWYTSPFYNGPWETVYYSEIPFALRRYPVARIHYYRDYYFRRYHNHGDWRGYQHFRPDRREFHGARHDLRSPAFNAPGRHYNGHWNGHSYGAPNISHQGNRNRPDYMAPARPHQWNGNRPPYTRSDGHGHNVWASPVHNGQERHDRGNWNRPANRSPDNSDHGNRGGQFNARSNGSDLRNWGHQGRGR